MSLDAASPAHASVLPTADDVEAAAIRLAKVVVRTPLATNARWSAELDAHVRVKREDLQAVRSYKLRGAYNLVAQLDADQRARGVVTASAGNHAQGLAYACAALRVRGRIYVPRTTPRQKRDRIAALGQEFVETIVLGDTYDDSAAAAAEDAARTGATMVPAFDDARTLTGQGTVAVEVVEQLAALGEDPPDVLVVPVGGGGLLAGTLTWVRERHPQVRVVGVEPEGAASMAAALAAGHPVKLPDLDTFVDGASVRRVGDVTHAVVARQPVELVAVPEGAICVEMLAMYQTDGIIAEPAGALATAALAGYVHVEPGQSVVAIVSGGNNDVSRYAEIIERALVHEGRKHYFLVEFPQEPGALRRFLDEVLGPDDDVTLFEYVKRSNREFGPALVGIEIPTKEDLPGLLARMAAAPPSFERISAAEPLYRYLL
ncbi:threonine ammonia-lyase IlvA [Kineococcus rhizosphaerae]|uniref:L-threonine dehydratase n=1 Tax=Kineococcus rhizosphaerae TaxID=559628 RepID=A0A2T0QZ86_9ACTN|nr:threonine ammonia-lyase IlvA [Kineococcus rhizosphaerae]PRY11840.1 L-threonine ammonia-lyase [Kineococcus rhizosphaerae]